MSYLITGARPYGGDAADILITDGRIAAIGEHARRCPAPR